MSLSESQSGKSKNAAVSEVAAAKAPRPAPSAKPAAPESEFSNNCAALDIKPNSVIATNPDGISTNRVVDLTRNYLGGHGFEALISALYANTALEELLVPSNGLSNESVVFFSKMFATHPSLRVIDFSGNPISLPASTALIELVHKNKIIVEIRLENTLIDPSLARKIKRTLNLRKGASSSSAASNGSGPLTISTSLEVAGGNSSSTPTPRGASGQLSSKAAKAKSQLVATSTGEFITPYEAILREYEPKREEKRRAKEEADRAAESHARQTAGQLAASKGAVPPAVDPISGWTLINIAAITTPAGHVSELHQLEHDIVPRLNKAFESRKVFFNVLANFTEPTHAAVFGRLAEKLGVAVDFTANVVRASPFVVELLGDSVGLLESPVLQTGTARNNSGAAATAAAAGAYLVPLNHLEHQAAVANPDNLLIVMRRSTTRKLHVPPPLMPLISDDPTLVMPDLNSAAVRVAVAKAHGVPTLSANFDYADAVRRYEEHLKFCETALTSAGGSELVIPSYPAVFEGSNQDGEIIFKGLEFFTDALYERLFSIASAMFTNGARPSVPKLPAVLSRSAELSVAKKNILGKVELYTVSPPSRNLLLVHGPPGSSRTTTLAASVLRMQKKPSNVVITHFCRNPWLSDEPSDRRCLFLHLLSQLSVDNKPLQIAEKETDVERIEQIFTETLAKTAAGLEDGKVLILVIDGVDDLDPPVLPSASLRKSETGVDIWRPSMRVKDQRPEEGSVNTPTSETAKPATDGAPATTGSNEVGASSSSADGALLNFLPLCLARNLRIVLSADSNSHARSVLEARGRDSCDLLALADAATNEAEQVLVMELKKLGINLSEEEIATIRSKDGCKSCEYIYFVLDAIRRRTEEPSFQSQLNVIETLPQTTNDMCIALVNRLEGEFGASLMRRLFGLLAASRLGLIEYELAELLSRDGKSKLPAWELNKLLRLLRPVLHPNTSAGQSKHHPHVESNGNGLHAIVSIRCRAFSQIIAAKYLTPQSDDGVTSSAAAAQAATEPYHQILATFYKKILEKKPHPLQRKAARDYGYHVVMGRRWNQFMDTVVTLEHVAECYAQGLGYQLLRELIRGFNTYEATSSSTPSSTLEARLAKIKDYVYFVRDHNVNLVQFPHMVQQIAIGCSPDSYIHRDAVDYFSRRGDQPHLVVVNRSKGKLHRDAVNTVLFSPNGLRATSCSDDRSIRIFNLFGESVLQICQSASKVKKITYSATSRYLVACSEDKSIFVLDATNGHLVSKFSGHQSAVRSLCMSVRGRYTATGCDDRTMRVLESETGALLATVPHGQFVTSAINMGATVSCIVPHPVEEQKFFSSCDSKLLGWTLNISDAKCEETLCIQAHRTLPITQVFIAQDGAFAVTVCGEKSPSTSNTSSSSAAIRTEESVKVFSVNTGRQLASLLRGKRGAATVGSFADAPGIQLAALSQCERLLACALLDGRILVYRLDYRSYSPDPTTAAPAEVAPLFEYPGFLNHTVTVVSHMAFSHDSSTLCIAGNERQIKLLSTAELLNAEGGAAPKPEATAEFLTEHAITSMGVTWQPQQQDGAEIVVGDGVGRVLFIALRKHESGGSSTDKKDADDSESTTEQH